VFYKGPRLRLLPVFLPIAPDCFTCSVEWAILNRGPRVDGKARIPMTDQQEPQTNTTPEATYQFGLRTLLLLPVMLALAIPVAMFAGWAWIFFALGLLIPFTPWPRRSSPHTDQRKFMIGAATSIVSLAWIVVWLAIPEDVPLKRQCRHNLKQIALALHNYHDTYGSFPPAYIADEYGRPIHSWRVLILPFLDHQALYDQYRFDEPWNGPHNINLVEIMPSVYRCASDDTGAEACTNYVVMIGPRTAWPGDTPVRMSDIADGTRNTWLVVEVADSGIAWSEPRDLHVQQMARELNASAGQGISSKHPGGAQVVCADGSAHFVPELLPPEDIRALLTIAGGESVEQDW